MRGRPSLSVAEAPGTLAGGVHVQSAARLQPTSERGLTELHEPNKQEQKQPVEQTGTSGTAQPPQHYANSDAPAHFRSSSCSASVQPTEVASNESVLWPGLALSIPT